MSVVTGVMLLLGAGDWNGMAISEVQTWLESRAMSWRLTNVEDGAGGNKHPQFEAWCAGINLFDEDGFADFVTTREWRDPENMVLIMQPEEGPTRIFTQQRRFESAPEIIIRKID